MGVVKYCTMQASDAIWNLEVLMDANLFKPDLKCLQEWLIIYLKYIYVIF